MLRRFLTSICLTLTLAGCTDSSTSNCIDSKKIVGKFKKVGGELKGLAAGDSGFGLGPLLDFQPNGRVNNESSGGYCDYCLIDGSKVNPRVAEIHSHMSKYQYLRLSCGYGTATARVDFTNDGFTVVSEAFHSVTRKFVISGETASYTKVE